MAFTEQAYLSKASTPLGATLRTKPPRLILAAVLRIYNNAEQRASTQPRYHTPYILLINKTTKDASGKNIVVAGLPERNCVDAGSSLAAHHEYSRAKNELFLGKAARNFFLESTGLSARDIDQARSLKSSNVDGTTIIFRDKHGVMTQGQETIIVALNLGFSSAIPAFNMDVFPEHFTDQDKQQATTLRMNAMFVDLRQTMQEIAPSALHDDHKTDRLSIASPVNGGRVLVGRKSLFAMEELAQNTPFFQKGLIEIAPPPYGRKNWIPAETLMKGVENPYDWKKTPSGSGRTGRMGQGLSPEHHANKFMK